MAAAEPDTCRFSAAKAPRRLPRRPGRPNSEPARLRRASRRSGPEARLSSTSAGISVDPQSNGCARNATAGGEIVAEHRTVFRAVAEIAARAPDAIALSSGTERWSHAALVRDAQGIAGGRSARDRVAGTTIGIVADNHAISCIVWLAAARLGIAISPRNAFLKPPELADLLDNLCPRLLLCDDAHAPLARGAVRRAGLATEVVPLGAALIGADPRRGPHPEPRAIHEIGYTSGTTSMPKRVAISHATVLFRARQDVIRRGDENFASKQVEEVPNAHPCVDRVAVSPVPDPLFVQEAKAILACRPGATPMPSSIWSWCDERLTAFKVPRRIEFRDMLPTSASGRTQQAPPRREPSGGRLAHDRRASPR